MQAGYNQREEQNHRQDRVSMDVKGNGVQHIENFKDI